MIKGAKQLLNCIKNSEPHKSIYEFINPILTDVSLRDGIQSMAAETMPTHKKIDLFHKIVDFGAVKNIEMGSLVSPKCYPIMNDVQTIYNYGAQYLENKEPLTEMRLAADGEQCELPDLYVLVPNKGNLIKGMKANIKNFSFITSVSNSFQLRNVNKGLVDTNVEIISMIQCVTHHKYPSPYKVKLYISCVDHCPFEGKISNDVVIQEIVKHSYYSFDELCLSDTCGKLTFKNYKHIIDECIDKYNINPERLSIHLHVNNENRFNVENIIRYSLNRKIRRFDISMINGGGCSMTIKNKDLNRNMDYDMFFKILYKYVDENVQKLKEMEK